MPTDETREHLIITVLDTPDREAKDEASAALYQYNIVETSSFQAPGFCKRHGYEEFGRVEFGLAGHARVFLRKDLQSS